MPTDPLVSSDTQDAAATPDTSTDGGWETESHSASLDAPPVDTTLESTSDRGEAPPLADHGGVGSSTRDHGSASSQVPKKKPLASVQARIDKAVLAQRTAERRADEALARAQALERQLQERATPPARPAAATPPASAPAASPKPTDAGSMRGLPAPPQYVNFETDADYNAAVEKWNADVESAFAAREAKLKAEIAGDVEAKRQAERDEQARRTKQAETQTKFAEMRAQHPDFDALVDAGGETFQSIDSFFVQDMVVNTPEGGELLYTLAADPDLAVALGSLPLPSRPLADAVRTSPAALALMKHFATDAGREEFLTLRTLPLDAVNREIGRLEMRLDTADRGPVTRVHPITNAVPPAKPPVGSPRAREVQSSGRPTGRFDDWMAQEDARERTERLRAAGVPVAH